MNSLFRSTVSFCMAAIMLVPSTLSAATDNNFKDVPDNHPFSETIGLSRISDYVSGHPDGTFKPDITINRAEFITMVIRSITSNPTGANCFPDVKNEWFASRVCEAKRRGLISGYLDGRFKPATNINFAEASLIIAKANGLYPGRPRGSEPWYKPAIVKLEGRKAIPVTIDIPWKKISRAEALEIIWRLKTNTQTKPTKTFATLSASMPTLASCPELKEKVAVLEYRRSKAMGGRQVMMMDMVEGDEADSEESAPTPMQKSTNEGAADSYSSTNVQVQGVDEADVIKNDGEFIYMVSGKTVRIVKAHPPANMQEMAKLTLSNDTFRPRDLYVAGTKLVVIGTMTREHPATEGPASKRLSIYPIWQARTAVYIIDIENKGAPHEDRAIELDGSEVSSRRVGDKLYLVTNSRPNYYHILQTEDPIESVLPMMRDTQQGGESLVAPCTAIRYIPEFEELNFVTVASVDIDDPSEPMKKEVIMGSGDTVYASPESLYVAATRYDYQEVGIFDVWAPRQTTERTRIMRFALNKGSISFVGEGTVEGHLLNQFAMDEEGDAFRIATTIGDVFDTYRKSTNNIIILDRNNLSAAPLGSVKNLAPGEKIYSVRFLGDRAYMVTFKKVDPFFVIDVGNPRDPKVLGELKIPGYSDYLHPFDENHVIGFGKDAVDPVQLREEGAPSAFLRAVDFAWYQGMKIALFDVTDVANPKVLHKEVIGDRGTESELLHNHKALFFDKDRGLLAFPVTVAEVTQEMRDLSSDPGNAYGKPVFQGAYIYHLDLDEGFSLRGRITHLPADYFADESTRWGADSSPLAVRRVVSIGDFLYTVSRGMIKALSSDTVKEMNSLDVSYEKDEEPIYDY